jgi:hypothetical protein
MHDHVAWSERVHEFNFKAIGVFIYVINIHPASRACATDNGTAVGVQRPQPLVHGLVETAKTVENVTNGGNVKVLTNPGKSLLVVGK